MSFQEVNAGQLLRAALEGTAYAVKANLVTIEEVTGLRPRVLYLGGGMSRSRTFGQVLSHLLQMEVRVSGVARASALGAAKAAAVAAGIYRSLQEAVREGHISYSVLHPDPSTSADYQEHYQRWLSLYRKLNEP
jgi:sugar (pentulose or hexulose) kinase